MKPHGIYRYRLGCRCHVCTLAATSATRIYNSALENAGRWVRETHPTVFAGFLDAEYAKRGLPRRPPGRPRKDVA